jgi:cyclohexadienyl dehydratase
MKKTIASIFLTISLLSLGYSTLLVGTTGDYAPFSTLDKTSNKYHGKDISLIEKYAKATNQNIKFIKTTWQNAATDLKNHKFDVFVGGMTITPARKESFLFSTAQESFHKAAMTQCSKLKRFKTFANIDSPSTLVVENRGGTNEKIALEKLKQAKLLIVNDNQAAINSLTNGIDKIYPDIMFTDTSEINYLHSINPKLCMIPVDFDKNISYKAFMFNKDKKGQILKNSFNAWFSKNHN